MLINRLSNFWQNQWQDNLWLYLISLFCLISGVTLGSLAVKTLSAAEANELVDYLNIFLAGIDNLNFDKLTLVRQSLYNNGKAIFYIWFLGLTVIGAPLILVLMAVKGFVLGFTVGFLVQEKGLQGILLTIFSLIPPNLLIIPASITASAMGISFSVWLLRGRFKGRNYSLMQQFLVYSLVMGFLGIVVMGGGLVEAYLSPLLVKLVIAYF